MKTGRNAQAMSACLRVGGPFPDKRVKGGSRNLHYDLLEEDEREETPQERTPEEGRNINPEGH